MTGRLMERCFVRLFINLMSQTGLNNFVRLELVNVLQVSSQLSELEKRNSGERN